MNQSIRRLAIGLSLAALSSYCSLAGAKDFQYALRTGAAASDNISRVAFNPEGDTIAEVGVGLAVDHQSRRFRVNAYGDFAYQDYLQNSYEDEVIGNLTAEAEFAFVPEYFTWTIGEDFGQTRQDLSAGITPGNRENINTFETGPDIIVPLFGKNQLDLFGRYRSIDYEVTNLDSERNSVGAAFKHLLSAKSWISLNYDLEEVEYKELGDQASFDRENAFISYEVYNDRNYLTVDGGVSRVTGADGDDQGPLARVSLTHQITPRNMLWVEYSREFSDAGYNVSQYASMPTTDLSDLALSQTSDPFTANYAMIGWNITGRRTDLQISGSRSQETYAESDSDRVSDELKLNLSRAFGVGWTGVLSVNYDRSDFETTEPDYSETTAALSMSYRLGRRFYCEASYSYMERSGDLQATNYSENRLWLRVRYGDVVVTRFGPIRERAEKNQQ